MALQKNPIICGGVQRGTQDRAVHPSSPPMDYFLPVRPTGPTNLSANITYAAEMQGLIIIKMHIRVGI